MQGEGLFLPSLRALGHSFSLRILGTLCLADATVKGGSVVPAHRACPVLGEGLMVDLGLIHTVCFLLWEGRVKLVWDPCSPGLRWDLGLPDTPVK